MVPAGFRVSEKGQREPTTVYQGWQDDLITSITEVLWGMPNGRDPTAK